MAIDSQAYTTPVCRYYIDVRPYAPAGATRRPSDRDYEAMPLLHTLPKDTQESIMRYLRKQDRYMSLASALLKHVFIHRQARVPWDQVRIARTPKPHARPYWDPPSSWSADFAGLEFNVSHQAGMVVLVGCRTGKVSGDVRATGIVDTEGRANGVGLRVGVDVACTNEGPRTPELTTQDQLEEWVDVFSEMFGEQERFDMKYSPVSEGAGPGAKARRFYTYWALKEAYIKLVGEGLLAPWLRELQFGRVPIPKQAEKGNVPEWDERRSWTKVSPEQMRELNVQLGGEEVSDELDIQLEGFEKDFVVATMMKGVVESADSCGRWKELDIFADIGPCATNRCGCLS